MARWPTAPENVRCAEGVNPHLFAWKQPPAKKLGEIKHDGFRIIARKKGAQVWLYSRPGNDLTYRFPLIVETLRSRSCIIDGEAVACDDNGVASFDLVGERTKAAIAERQKFSSLLKMLRAGLT
jgi:ATP-dependent DNA ligase